MGCLLSTIGCCFCQSAASLCCACLPSCRSSTAARVMYTIIFAIVAIISVLFLIPGMEEIPTYLPHSDGSQLKGFGGVYRVCFGATLFYLFFSILMIRVRDSTDCRAKIQNGFWFFKFGILGMIIFGSLYLPKEFNYPWMYIGMIGGALYLLVQLILLIDFAHSWNDKWLTFYEEDDSKIHAFGLLFFTVFFYICSLVSIVLFYIYYAGDETCTLNKTFISINMILCVFVSVVSILPRVHEYFPKSGLLQSSLITLYVMYLTWSSMTNNPDPICNPSLYNATMTENGKVELKFDWQTIIGLIILLLTVTYSAFKSASGTSTSRLILAEENDSSQPTNNGKTENGGQVVWDNETDAVSYSYSMLHFSMMLAVLYLMVTLTNWYSPEKASVLSLNANFAGFWVKIITSWVCVFLYGWTLVAPCIFPDRDFS